MTTKRKRIIYSPTAVRRAVLYARYSDELQRDSWSIDAQLADLRVYCDQMGWQVLDEVCLDEAITGSTVDRPGLDRAMTLIREGKANVLSTLAKVLSRKMATLDIGCQGGKHGSEQRLEREVAAERHRMVLELAPEGLNEI